MNKTIQLQGHHHKKISKFARLLKPFNGDVSEDVKLAKKNGFNVQLDHQAKIQGWVCAKCSKHYIRSGWMKKHKCS